jgi:hypothetical protein
MKLFAKIQQQINIQTGASASVGASASKSSLSNADSWGSSFDFDLNTPKNVANLKTAIIAVAEFENIYKIDKDSITLKGVLKKDTDPVTANDLNGSILYDAILKKK